MIFMLVDDGFGEDARSVAAIDHCQSVSTMEMTELIEVLLGQGLPINHLDSRNYCMMICR